MNKGFTLIELLVVAGIIILLGGIGVASYNRFNQSRITRNYAEEILTGLRVAQNNAQTGKKSDCGITPLEGWQANLSAGLLSIQEVCGSIATTPSNLVTLPSGFTITVNPATTKFTFLTPSGTTDLSSNISITVSSSDVDDNVTVNVTRSGEIGLPSPSST